LFKGREIPYGTFSREGGKLALMGGGNGNGMFENGDGRDATQKSEAMATSQEVRTRGVYLV